MAGITRVLMLFSLVFPVWSQLEPVSAVAQKVVRFVIKPGMVQKATAQFDELGRAVVRIELTRDAARQFGELTGKNVGNLLELVIDGKVVVKAKINERIDGGEIQVSGNYTLEEAQAIAQKLQPNQAQSSQTTGAFDPEAPTDTLTPGQWYQQLSQVLEFILRLFRGR